jgi:hypothetical protein
MVFPENIQQRLIRNLCRIVLDPDGFAVVSQFGVRGILCGTACITDRCTDGAFDEPEPGVCTPESPHGEGGRLRSGRCDKVYRWPNAEGRRRIRFGLLHGISPFLRDRALGASFRLCGQDRYRRENDSEQGKKIQSPSRPDDLSISCFFSHIFFLFPFQTNSRSEETVLE